MSAAKIQGILNPAPTPSLTEKTSKEPRKGPTPSKTESLPSGQPPPKREARDRKKLEEKRPSRKNATQSAAEAKEADQTKEKLPPC